MKKLSRKKDRIRVILVFQVIIKVSSFVSISSLSRDKACTVLVYLAHNLYNASVHNNNIRLQFIFLS